MTRYTGSEEHVQSLARAARSKALTPAPEPKHVSVAQPPSPLPPRPRLSASTVEDYLDWLTLYGSQLKTEQTALCLKAAELVIRTRATDAQSKATQHTLVEQGVIDPPPQAS